MRSSENLDKQTISKFEDGFPHHWRQILRSAYAKASRAVEEDEDTEELDSSKTVDLHTPSRSRTPQTVTSSRSKRRRVPPLDFWCNERIVDGKVIRPESADLPLWSPTMSASKKNKKV
jgi:hypothetical protein